MWFAVQWLIGGVAFGLVFIALGAEMMGGGPSGSRAMARRRAAGAMAEVTEAVRLDGLVHHIEVIDRSMSYQEIARQHTEMAALLDGLMHPYEAINGRTAYPLLTEDYYRDPERFRRRWQRERDWHARMAEKYRRAALRPSEPVPPDPPP